MSKPSASGRPRKFRNDGKYHRANLGGGNGLKAVTRTRRAAASRVLGQLGDQAARERKALEQLLRVTEELEGEAA